MKFITSPIFYVNGKPHIGHLYTSFAVDVLARWEKVLGKNVFLATGTDEHGQKVEMAALKNDKTPKDFVDEAHLPFKEMLARANVDYNVFIRTTDDMHKKTACYIWDKIVASGLTYEGSYEGWYSKTDEAYYKDDEVKDGHSIETGSPVEYMKESCIFFSLSKMKDRLLEYYQNNPEVIRPASKYSEVMGLLKMDLPDLAISRSRFNWGIPVPNLPGHVMYVWIDALTNYLTVIGYPRNTNYEKYWNNVVHVVGKDILKFHAIYWPAFLMAAGLNPPTRIFAHGWWSVDNKKMSKSLGNVIDPFELLDKYGADELRYFMFSALNFGNDGSFSYDILHNIINTQLANEFGNLIQRTCMLCYNKYGSTVSCDANNPELDEHSKQILKFWDDSLAQAKDHMENQDISNYLNTFRQAVIETNKYIDHAKPWSAEDPRSILGTLCLCIQRMVLVYAPLLPTKTKQIASMIGLNELVINEKTWNVHTDFALKKPEGMFSRITTDENNQKAK